MLPPKYDWLDIHYTPYKFTITVTLLFRKRKCLYIIMNEQQIVVQLMLPTDKKAVLSQEEPRDAAVDFDTYRILQRHRAVSLPQHGFLVGLCRLQSMLAFSLKFPN